VSAKAKLTALITIRKASRILFMVQFLSNFKTQFGESSIKFTSSQES